MGQSNYPVSHDTYLNTSYEEQRRPTQYLDTSFMSANADLSHLETSQLSNLAINDPFSIQLDELDNVESTHM